MADSQPLDSLRLTLMQDVLPVGLAFVDRVRTDGAAKAVESVAKGEDPLEICASRVNQRPGRCVSGWIRSAPASAIL